MMALRRGILASQRLVTLSAARGLVASGGQVPYSTANVALLAKENKRANKHKETFWAQLCKLETFDEVLGSCVDRDLRLDEATAVLKRFSGLCKQTPPLPNSQVVGYLEDAQFKRVEDVLNENILKLDTHQVLQILYSTLPYLKEDTYFIHSLETQVKWLLSRMSFSQLVKVLEIHGAHQETDLRRQVFEEALLMAEKRWTELSAPKDVISLMYLTRGLASPLTDKPELGQNRPSSGMLVDKLEDKALVLCEAMSCKQLYRILYIISQGPRRNTPLLRALVYHLNQQTLDLTDIQMCNLFFALAKLSVFDEDLLGTISAELRSRSSSLSFSLVESCVNSMGVLRWRDTSLLNELAHSLLVKTDTVKTRQVLSLLKTCMLLDIVPSELPAHLSRVTQQMSQDLSSEPGQWLDFVWYLMILRQADTPLINTVCNDTFLGKLEGVAHSLEALHIHKLKLKNLLFAARHELKSDVASLDLGTQEIPVRNERRLHESVLIALGNMLTLEQYVQTDIVLDTGYMLDVKLLVNGEGEPQKLSAPHTADTCRVVLKMVDFSDMTQNDVQPTGFHNMVTRHLKLQGYTVIQVPHHEFFAAGNIVKRIEYIQQRLKSAA